MAIGCGPKCAKVLLIIFNFIFWLSGAAILGVGIYLIVDTTIVRYLEIIQVSSNDPYLKTAAFILIGIGAFVFVVGFFGCCGAIKESKCMLGMYIFFLVIVMAGELAAGVLVAVYKDKITKELQKGMQTQIKEKYGNGTAFDAAWDLLQFERKCCGAKDIKDYDGAIYKDMKTGSTKNDIIPRSCCVAKDGVKAEKAPSLTNDDLKDYTTCIKQADNFIAGTTDTLNAKVIHTKGCYNQVKAWFERYSIILIGVGCGIAGLEIIGFIFAICLCRNIGEEVD
ncbi:tetraspanin-18-like isoform X1 [Lineus longissimus]|uniref:tetraspanin-18-like isoform X1 n=1 Tax=Lineus longissimus TaxID=88925 RepID=UPI002B4DCD1B